MISSSQPRPAVSRSARPTADMTTLHGLADSRDRDAALPGQRQRHPDAPPRVSDAGASSWKLLHAVPSLILGNKLLDLLPSEQALYLPLLRDLRPLPSTWHQARNQRVV
jgi:hypothetical protein